MASLSHMNMEVVSTNGVVLSLPQKAGMQSSLPLLQKNYKFTKVFFWGKLTGTASDYYIAMGTEESYGNKKFFFWCARAYCDARLLPSTACGAAQPLTSGHARLLTRASLDSRHSQPGWRVLGAAASGDRGHDD